MSQNQPGRVWPVHHPGLGVIEYPTEAEARTAAGTAGTMLPPRPAEAAVGRLGTPSHADGGARPAAAILAGCVGISDAALDAFRAVPAPRCPACGRTEACRCYVDQAARRAQLDEYDRARLVAAQPWFAAAALRAYADRYHGGAEGVAQRVDYGTGVEYDAFCSGCGASWGEDGCTEREQLKDAAELRDRADELERGTRPPAPTRARWCTCGTPLDPIRCGARGFACAGDEDGPVHTPGCLRLVGHNGPHDWQRGAERGMACGDTWNGPCELLAGHAGSHRFGDHVWTTTSPAHARAILAAEEKRDTREAGHG